MCYRYYLGHTIDYEDRYGVLNVLRDNRARYNISPTEKLPIITFQDKKEMKIAKWGLIPFWAKGDKIAARLANARSETIDVKPSFKKAFRTQRCLVPASGFYEWEKVDGPNLPYLVTVKNEPIFSFAGIYDYWINEKKEQIMTYSVLTTEPNSEIKKIHDRMPVVLPREDEDKWLEPDFPTDELKKLLRPISDKETEMYRVSTEVNNARNEGPELVERLKEG